MWPRPRRRSGERHPRGRRGGIPGRRSPSGRGCATPRPGRHDVVLRRRRRPGRRRTAERPADPSTPQRRGGLIGEAEIPTKPHHDAPHGERQSRLRCALVSDSVVTGPTLILLVRHGATEWSETGRHTGRTDVPLIDKGRHQADRLPPLLATLSEGALPLVFTSPLERAGRRPVAQCPVSRRRSSTRSPSTTTATTKV